MSNEPCLHRLSLRCAFLSRTSFFSLSMPGIVVMPVGLSLFANLEVATVHSRWNILYSISMSITVKKVAVVNIAINSIRTPGFRVK